MYAILEFSHFAKKKKERTNATEFRPQEASLRDQLQYALTLSLSNIHLLEQSQGSHVHFSGMTKVTRRLTEMQSNADRPNNPMEVS